MFPLTLSDFNLWLAIMAIILLAASELLKNSPENEALFNLNKKVLGWTAIDCSLAFAVTDLLHVPQVF